MCLVDEHHNAGNAEREVFDDEFSCKREDREVRCKDECRCREKRDECAGEVKDDDGMKDDPPPICKESESNRNLEDPEEFETRAERHKRYDRMNEVKDGVITSDLEKPEPNEDDGQAPAEEGNGDVLVLYTPNFHGFPS